MPTKYSRSPWLEQFPKTRIPAYPQQRGTQSVDAVIVGGGLTGCATAYSFAAAGVRVILLEANRIGQGVTAAAGGWIADDPGVAFADVEKALGRRPARQAFHVWHRAALDFISLLRRLDVKCQLEPRPSITVAVMGPPYRPPEQRDRLNAGSGAGR